MFPQDMVALRDVRVDASTEQLLEDVDKALTRVQSLGDFSPEVREQIGREFLADRLSDTLIIESIYVNARVTRAILEGHALSDADSHGITAVENVNRANLLMEHEASMGRNISVALVREINSRIVENTGEVRHPGAFRDVNVSITGAKLQPPDWTLLLEAMQDFENQARESDVPGLVSAAWAHWVIARLHPFENGNGRTARLVQDFFLIRGGLLPVGIPAGKRSEYYEALALADTEQDLAPLISIIASAEIFALEKTYNIAREGHESAQRIADLARQVHDTATRQRGTEYQAWAQRVALVGDEVKRVFDNFSRLDTAGITFRVNRYDIASRETWNELREQGLAPNTWYLRLILINQGRPELNILLYFRRHRVDWTIEDTRQLARAVGLFVDIRLPKEKFAPGDRLKDPFISLREIVPTAHGYEVFTAPNTKTADERSVGDQGGNERWAREHVDHLGPTIATFLSDVLDRAGLR